MDASPLQLILSSWAGPTLAGVWGALWGSFVNVVIERLPRGESVMRPASHCLACQTPIRWYDNVPLVSYLLLGGRCRACRARFSPRYALVEALGVVLGLLCFHQAVTLGTGSPAMLLASFFVSHLFALGLMAILFIDLSTMIIPDAITLPMLLLGGPAAVALGRITWIEAVVGAAAGFLPVYLLREAWLRLRGIEGIGLGDAKLLAAVGAVLGWQALPVVVLLASVEGLLVAVPLRLAGRSLIATGTYQGTAVRAAGAAPASEPVSTPEPASESASAPEIESDSLSESTPAEEPVVVDEVPAGAVPFGPFLALAAVQALLWGKPLSEWLAGVMDGMLGG